MPRAAKLALAGGSSASVPKVAPRAMELGEKSCRQGVQTALRPEVLPIIANAEEKQPKKKAKKVLHFPKTCEVFWLLPSASFTPAGTGLNSGGREKNRNFKKKTDIFVFAFPWYGKI